MSHLDSLDFLVKKYMVRTFHSNFLEGICCDYFYFVGTLFISLITIFRIMFLDGLCLKKKSYTVVRLWLFS